jgi:homoserine O-succinyltransferase/O-acetyltransferase
MGDHNEVKIAILDLYEGHPNQGMRCIREIINQYGESNNLDISWDEFDVRLKNEVPDLSYDLYISSGGPGSPLDTIDTEWEKHYFHWLQQVEKWNDDPANSNKKHVFFICHSFQLACRHYKIGHVTKRKSTAFGIFPMHMLHEGKDEQIFEGLNDPFFGVDSRDYQVIQPHHNRLKELGARILCIEKERPHIPLERAIMAIRFNPYMIGTQFHPEADAIGMSMYLQTEEKKKTVIESHGYDKWEQMIEHLNDPDKILWTYSHILPNFLDQSVNLVLQAEKDSNL